MTRQRDAWRRCSAADEAARRAARRKRIRGLLFDIDDTLTTDGKLTAQAYGALERAEALGGRIVVPITGRPAGWCDHIARMWPVDAVVGENGAFYFWLRRRQARQAVHDDAPNVAPEPPPAARPSRSASSRRCPARARLGPALSRDRSRHRLSARTCRAAAGSRRAHRRAHARRRTDRQGQLDPRQRLVRQLRQAGDAARLCFAERFGIAAERAKREFASRAIRRTMRRCSPFSRIRSASRTWRASPASWSRAEVRDAGRRRRAASPSSPRICLRALGMMEWWWAYLAIGAAVGFLAGLLGIGGGMIMVPMLVFVFTAQGLSGRAHDAPVARARRWRPSCSPRSPACARITAHGAVDWHVARAMAPGIVAGALAATLVAG